MKYAFCLLLFVALSVEAQEFGRSEDGQAYRKTPDGFEVSDYLAELEVSNQELQAQLVQVKEELASYKLSELNSEPQETPIKESSVDCAKPLSEMSELVRRQDAVIAAQNEQLKSCNVGPQAVPTLIPAKSINTNSQEVVAQIQPAAASTNSNPNRSMNQLILSIRQLKEQRLLTYQRYNSIRDRNGDADLFKPEELVTSNGIPLQALLMRSKKSSGTSQQFALIRDFREIESKLQSDLVELNGLLEDFKSQGKR
jgi:hypothetical protein